MSSDSIMSRLFAAEFQRHALIYRPAPNRDERADRLKLNGFRIEEDREAAELYFLSNYQTIAAVFSVSSTVSRRR